MPYHLYNHKKKVLYCYHRNNEHHFGNFHELPFDINSYNVCPETSCILNIYENDDLFDLARYFHQNNILPTDLHAIFITSDGTIWNFTERFPILNNDFNFKFITHLQNHNYNTQYLFKYLYDKKNIKEIVGSALIRLCDDFDFPTQKLRAGKGKIYYRKYQEWYHNSKRISCFFTNIDDFMMFKLKYSGNDNVKLFEL